MKKAVYLILVLGIFFIGSTYVSGQTEDEIRATLKVINEAFNAHIMDPVMPLLAEDFVYDINPEPLLMDKEGFRAYIEAIFTGFPDIVFPEELILVSGNIAVIEHTIYGTHLAEWQGIPPTGKPNVATPHIDILEFENGLIKRFASYLDTQIILIQLGVMEAPELPELIPSFSLPNPESTGLSPLEANEEWLLRWKNHDLNSLSKMAVENFEYFIGPMGVPLNRDQYMAANEIYFEGFPDMTFSITKTIDMGDGWVLNEGVYEGTHDGLYFNIPATGKSIVNRGVTLHQYNESGQLIKGSTYADNLTILAQLGLLAESSAKSWYNYK